MIHIINFLQNYWANFNQIGIFSSPGPKAQVSFSDQNLSIAVIMLF